MAISGFLLKFDWASPGLNHPWASEMISNVSIISHSTNFWSAERESGQRCPLSDHCLSFLQRLDLTNTMEELESSLFLARYLITN